MERGISIPKYRRIGVKIRLMFDNVSFVHGGKFVSRGRWIHPTRINDTTEIIIVTKGVAYLRTGDNEAELREGDVLLIGEGTPHGGYRESEGDVSFYWLHFKGDFNDFLPSANPFHPESTYPAELLSRQIIHYEKTAGYPKEATDYLIRVLLMELYASSLNTRSEGSRVFVSICEWIRQNSDLTLRVSDVAAHFSYNEDYVTRLFKRYSTVGIKEYIIERKLQRIKQALISGTASLREIASENSFSDYKYFLKYFKYHEGMSPSKFRELYQNQHINNK